MDKEQFEAQVIWHPYDTANNGTHWCESCETDHPNTGLGQCIHPHCDADASVSFRMTDDKRQAHGEVRFCKLHSRAFVGIEVCKRVLEMARQQMAAMPDHVRNSEDLLTGPVAHGIVLSMLETVAAGHGDLLICDISEPVAMLSGLVRLLADGVDRDGLRRLNDGDFGPDDIIGA